MPAFPKWKFRLRGLDGDSTIRFFWQESAACWLMSAAGGFSMFFAIAGDTRAFSVEMAKRFGLSFLISGIERYGLVCQSAVIIIGAVSAIRSFSFIFALLGVAAALAVVTPVGLFSVVPGLWLLIRLMPRFRLFPEFTPRWKGPGPPPPGHWR